MPSCSRAFRATTRLPNASNLWMFLTCCALIVGSTLCLGWASPHAFRIKSWKAEDGLPQNSVTSIVQTRDGYLWLGTFNGLARFDGVQFKVLVPETAPGLPSNR